MPLHNPLVNNSGSAVIDFGPTPVAEGQVTVTGQAGIGPNSRVKVWFAERSMADNDSISHLQAGVFTRLVSGQIVADTSFTVFVTVFVGLVAGTFRVDYRW